MNILISGIGKRNSLINLMRLEAKNYGLHIIGCDSNSFPPAKLAVEKFYQLPYAHENNFVDTYINLIKTERIEAFLTLIDPEIPRLSNIHEFTNSRAFHPVKSVALLCEDKFEFAKAAEFESISTIPTSSEPLNVYPFISKDRFGSAASGFRIYKDNSEEIVINKKNIIYQPFCNGRHYCVDAYVSYYSNQLIDLCIKEVVSKSKGESFLLKSVNSSKIVKFIEEICSWISLRGIVNFDVYEENGVLKLMEINCRFGGNYPASHAFGCNLIQYLYMEILNKNACKPNYSSYKPDQFVAKYFEFSVSAS